MDIGVVIKKYRKEAGMTQEEMANRLGVTTPAVNKWENSNSKPDFIGMSGKYVVDGLSFINQRH